MSVAELAKCPEVLKVYQTMFRTVKESETVDWRQHCFLVQSSGGGPALAQQPRYFSAETRQDLLRVEQAWTHNIVNSVIRLGVSAFSLNLTAAATGGIFGITHLLLCTLYILRFFVDFTVMQGCRFTILRNVFNEIILQFTLRKICSLWTLEIPNKAHLHNETSFRCQSNGVLSQSTKGRDYIKPPQVTHTGTPCVNR